MISLPVAAFCRKRQFGRTRALFRNDVDYASDCLRAPESAAGAAKNFDPFDIVRGQVSKVELPQSHAVNFYSIDHHKDLIAIRPANEYAGTRSTRPGLDDVDTRNISQCLDYGLCVLILHVLVCDDGD